MNNVGLTTRFAGKIQQKKLEELQQKRNNNIKLPELKEDEAILSTKSARNDNKFTWNEAAKNFGKGFLDQGKSMVETMIKHPLATAGGMAACTGLIMAAPLVGISGVALGSALSVGFLGLGAGKAAIGVVKAINHYSKGEKDQAELDFKKIGEGTFDVTSIVAPAGGAKIFNIASRSELGILIQNTKVFKNLTNSTSLITKPIGSALKSLKSLTSGNSALKSLTKSYSNAVNSNFSQRMGETLPSKLINGFHNKLVDINQKETVKGIKFINDFIDKFNPKHVIGSDFHGKKGSLKALSSKNPNGKNLHINGDIIDKGQHPVTAEKTNTRDVIKYVNEKLPEAKITYGNHEFQVAATQENLHTSYGKDLKGVKKSVSRAEYIEIAKAKYENLNAVLKKPSTNFYNEVLKPYEVSGEGLEEKVGQRLVNLFKSKLSKINETGKIPSSQKVLAEMVLKQDKNGKWILKNEAISGNKEFLQEVAAKEFYRFYSNFGGDIDKAAESFAKLYKISDDALPLQKMIYGLKEFHADFAKLKSNMHMFDIIKGGEKGDILLTHAGMPYYVNEASETVLLPKAILDAENKAQQGKFSQMIKDKNLSPVYGGEAEGDLNKFWFDRKDVTSDKIQQAYNEFNQLHAEQTGTSVNIKRGVIGHETRSNGLMDPTTEGWNNEFEHLLNNTDGVKVKGSIADGDLEVTKGKKMLQRRIVSAYDGKLIMADSAAGDAVDGKMGLLKPGEKSTFIPGHGPAVQSGEEIKNAKKFRHGAGLQVQRDGRIRDVYVRNDGTSIYKSKPGDYIYESGILEQNHKALLERLNANPELKQKFDIALSEYNMSNSSNLTMDEVSNSIVYYSQQAGKAESKVKDLITKLCPDNYFDVHIADPLELIEKTLKNKNNMVAPLIKANVSVSPNESIETAVVNLMKNITSENHGISVVGAKRIPGTNKIRLLLGNGADHSQALSAEISFKYAKNAI